MTKRFLVLPLLLLFASPMLAQDEPKTVRVLIDSQPAFAEITVDGKFIGTAPLDYRLAPGVHRLVLTRSHRQSWVRDLTVNPGLATRVTALMETSDEKPCAASATATKVEQ